MSINVNVGTIIPTAVVEVGNEITAEQLAAITSATGASGSNPFTTATHTHIIGNVTGLQTALDGKANTAHTHIVSDVTGLQTVLDNKASVSHTHDIASISGLSSALDEKAELVHTHIIANVTGLQTALDGKVGPVHTHTITDVTGLQSALDGKLSASHNHDGVYAKLTGDTFSGNIVRDNGLGQSIIGPASLSFSQTGGGGSFIAYESTRIVFADASIQSTASYSKAQSDAHLDTVATWVATKANLSGDTFTGKVNFTPSGGVAGLNLGIGGTSTDSITAGDLWISTGGANLNFRDGTGAWRIVASTSNTNAFSAPQIIDTTATSAGLRITQKGTGEAFRVEDSTSPDSTSFIISNDGKVGIGQNVGTALSADLDIIKRSSSWAVNIDASTNGGNGLGLIISGTSVSNTALQVNNGCARFEGGANFGGSSQPVVSRISTPVIATGTYNREIEMVIGGSTYRIPCRLI